jgi:hypothetical protein
MAINDDLLTQYQGHVVPQRYNVGFVILSYIVSLVGAGSTLELIYRRTGSRGLFNQYEPSFLFSACPHRHQLERHLANSGFVVCC